MSDLVKGYTDFVGGEPNGHPYEVYHADDVQEVLQGKDARIAELEKALRETPCQCHEAQGNGRDACARCEALERHPPRRGRCGGW